MNKSCHEQSTVDLADEWLRAEELAGRFGLTPRGAAMRRLRDRVGDQLADAVGPGVVMMRRGLALVVGPFGPGPRVALAPIRDLDDEEWFATVGAIPGEVGGAGRCAR